MEQELIKLMIQIIDMIDANDYQSYFFEKNRFHLIDKDRMIDFEATIGNHNYYLKDNIANNTYIATRKYIDDDVFIYHIFMQNSAYKKYISLFTKKELTGFIQLISVDQEGTIMCKNPDFIGLLDDKEELLKYVDEYFEFELEDDEDEENSLDHDLDNGDMNVGNSPDEKVMLDLKEDLDFEFMDIDDEDVYVDVGDNMLENESEDIDEDIDFDDISEDDVDSMFENEFTVTVNKKEIEGKEKIRIVSNCAVDTVFRYGELKEVAVVAENLKISLRDMEIER